VTDPLAALLHEAIVSVAYFDLTDNTCANDASIRQALIDRFGGKDAAIGRKASPGPLHGIAADVWSALALAVTHTDQLEGNL